MERSQQRLATLEQEKAGLLARLQQGQGQGQQGGDAAAAVPGGEGGEAAAVSGEEAAGGTSRAATEDSLRQELQAQVWAGGWPAAAGLLHLLLTLLPPIRARPCIPFSTYPPPLPYRCPPVQRELATRLQSEASALRQQLEAGGRCLPRVACGGGSGGGGHQAHWQRGWGAAQLHCPPSVCLSVNLPTGSLLPSTPTPIYPPHPLPPPACRRCGHLVWALRGPAGQPCRQGGARGCSRGGAGQPTHAAACGGAAAAGKQGLGWC